VLKIQKTWPIFSKTGLANILGGHRRPIQGATGHRAFFGKADGQIPVKNACTPTPSASRPRCHFLVLQCDSFCQQAGGCMVRVDGATWIAPGGEKRCLGGRSPRWVPGGHLTPLKIWNFMLAYPWGKSYNMVYLGWLACDLYTRHKPIGFYANLAPLSTTRSLPCTSNPSIPIGQ
jgi:hypothetical protein